MNLTPPQQARCDDRSRLTGGPDPKNWIVSALPVGWAFYGFHFFVNWNSTPPTLGNEIWLTRLIHFSGGENPETVSDASILNLFQSGPDAAEFYSLALLCNKYNQVVRVVLLPELLAVNCTEQTPVWTIMYDAGRNLIVSKTSLGWLMTQIQKHSGGPVWVGSKGLTYGTSAIECMLSKTKAAYPGDADAVIADDKGAVKCVIEYKKHTLDDNIGNHLVNRYYADKDKRKYERLDLLVTHYRNYANIPFVVFYYSTRVPVIRLQELGKLLPDRIEIVRDSEDINIAGLSDQQIASIVVNWLGLILA